MNKKHLIAFLAFLAFLCLYLSVHAQKAYFQQEVNYNIRVSLNDKEHFLNGDIEIEYINHSPDELSFIWMHLWPNAYANNNTELGKERQKTYAFTTILEKEDTRGYIDSLNFTSGTSQLIWEYHPQHKDICKVFLPQKLAPGESISIKTPFRVKIPDGSISRFGHSKQTYSVTQWYPKPAVYDRYGWHEMPYVDMGEFFSEYGSYNVFITVPQNYRVAATGVLHNEDEKMWLDSLATVDAALVKRDTILPSAPVTKTLHYSENKVHDFAWFADKSYHVKKDEVTLPNGKTVNTWVYFSDRNKEAWQKATTYVNDALYYYSKWNGNYPYQNCTAVEGPLSAGGGMEYPTITVIGEYSDTLQLDEVIMHEVGHNWFYGLLGSNERRYPYLDEGINSANEQRYMDVKYPNYTLSRYINKPFLGRLLELDKVNYRQFKEYSYDLNDKRNYNQALNLDSRDYTALNYGGLVYAKSANMFNHLRQYLGNDVYDSIFHAYFDAHVFQHVYPEDLEKAFKEGSDKNLDWFFNDWLATAKFSDYAIKKNKGSQILLKNTGEVNAPFLLQLVKDTVVTASKWVDGFEGKQWVDMGSTDYDAVYIDKNNTTYDFNRHNNYMRSKGMAKKVEPIKLRFGTSADIPDETEVYYIPFVTYTEPGGFMPGLVLHNKTPFQKQAEYEIAPMYSFKSGLLAGSAKLNFFIPVQSGFVRNIYLEAKGLQYASLGDSPIQKVGGEVKVEFRDPIVNNHEYYFYSKANYATRMEDMVAGSNDTAFNFYWNTGFRYKNISNRYPIDAVADFENSSDFSKLTFNADIDLGLAPKATFYLHVNSRTFVDDGPKQMYYQNQLMGTNGVSDYKYDNVFFNRFDGASMANGTQFINDGAGFSVASPQGFSKSWMHSVNLSYKLHSLIRPYVTGAIYQSLEKDTRLAFEAGVRVGFRNALEVYFPLYYHNASGEDLSKDRYDIYDNYFTNVHVMLNLHSMNLFKLRDKIPY